MLKILMFVASFMHASLIASPSTLALKVTPIHLTADGRCFRFQAEVADSAYAREQGLMFRKFLAADAGMFFVFPVDQNWTMWMSNTLIPLDILFISADGIIEKIHHSASPRTETYYRPDKPVRFALELNGGSARKINLKEGDHVYHELIPHPLPSTCQTAVTVQQVTVAQRVHQPPQPAVTPTKKPPIPPVATKP